MGVVEVTMRQGQELRVEDIHEVIVEIIKSIHPQGCGNCGLVGVDLVLRGGDPDLFSEISQLTANKNVLAVSQVSRGAIAAE